MSMYSGKCDIYDGYSDITDFSNVKFYAYNNEIIPLDIKSQKDLAPYYPYLAGIAASSKEAGSMVVLSRESYVDREERERLGWYLDGLMKYFRKCKRNKTEFIPEEAVKSMSFWQDNSRIMFKIAERIKILNGKGTEYDFLNGMHLSIFDMYRQNLFDTMIELGWDENKTYRWCFGLSRWCEWISQNNK